MRDTDLFIVEEEEDQGVVQERGCWRQRNYRLVAEVALTSLLPWVEGHSFGGCHHQESNTTALYFTTVSTSGQELPSVKESQVHALSSRGDIFTFEKVAARL